MAMLRRYPLAIVTIGVALGVVIVAFELVTSAGPRDGFTRPKPPPPVGAFKEGGVPARDVAIERVLTIDLPQLLAHKVTDEAGRHQLATALRDDPAFTNHGTALATAWREMIDTLDHWMNLESTDRSYRALSTELRARVDVVSDQLAAAQLGYYLDPEILAEHSRRAAGIYAYRIDEVAFVRADRDRMRVLGVRRLDHQDEEALLGMTTEELRDPVVLLDRIDDKIAAQILPALAGWPYPLGDDGWSQTSRGRAAAYAAGEAIRHELQIALGSEITADEATTRLRKLVAASVRHHEAQHGLDHDRDLAQPAALASHVRDPASDFAVRTRYELSAYLSQIASDMWIPQLTLWNLSRHAFHHGQVRVEEAYVAVIAIEGIARQLHIPSAGPVLHDGTIDRDRLAGLVGPIAARSTTELRSAAARLWVESFDEHLARIVDD